MTAERTTNETGGTERARETIASLKGLDCEALIEASSALVAAGAELSTGEREPLRHCLDSAGPPLRAALARFYVLLTPQAMLSDVAHDLMHHQDDFVRDSVSDTLAELGPRAREAVGRLLHDRDRDVRWYATEALAREHRDEDIPLLVDRLADDDFAIRWVASNGLLQAGASSVIPLLEALLEREPSPLLHGAARRVLSRVSASGELRELLDELVESLSHGTTVYQSPGRAREVLQRLRGAHRPDESAS